MLLISILTTVDNTVKECKLMNMHCKKKNKTKLLGVLNTTSLLQVSNYRNNTGQAKIS